MPGAVRSSKSGISVDSHGKIFQLGGSPLSQMLTHTRLHFPEAEEIFATLLSRSGATAHESDKGRYTRRMLELWGGLDPLAADLQPDVPARVLLREWISKDQGHGRIHQDRKYLRFSDAGRITGLGKHETRALLDRLLDRAVAHRGLVLHCQLCANSSFHHLADIGPGFRCPRCRRDNAIVASAWTTQANEPEWFYSLDEVAYLGLANNIHVPILAMEKLAAGAQSVLHMPEVIVRRPNQEDLEVDLWAVIDGRIVIGEAKKGDRLDEDPAVEIDRCAKLEQLARELTADTVVMATACPQWSDRTVDNLKKAVGGRFEIAWLTGLR